MIEILEKRVLLSHGDELNKEDTPYLKYKKFIKTPFWSFVANNLMPLTVLDFLGVKASKQSRKYGSRKFDEQEVRSKFRAGLKDYSDLSLHVYIGGHSHVSDTFQIDNLLYLNNGYPPKSNVFVVMDSSGARLEPLLM